MASVSTFGNLVRDLTGLAMTGVATGAAYVLVPATAGGGMDVTGIAATAVAILLTGIGVALSVASSVRVPRFGDGSLTAGGISTRSLGIAAVGMASAVIALATRPALPQDPVMLAPLAAYLLLCMATLVGMAKGVAEGSAPRLPSDPARTR